MSSSELDEQLTGPLLSADHKDFKTEPAEPEVTTSFSHHLQIDWACEEVHSMIFVWMCPASFQSKQREEQLSSCVVAWNPFYWMGFVPTVAALVIGRLFHSFFGP